MQETDETIYRRYLQSHDHDDLRLLFDRHRESLVLFLRGFVRREEDAEDLMMDTFAIVASGTARFNGKSSFKTWMFAIARNRAMTFLRKASREIATSQEPKTQEDSAPEFELLRQEKNLALYRAMETLPDEYRQALYLVYFEQMMQDEACRVMRKTRKQMYNLTERGRSALRETLKSMGFENAAEGA